MIGREYFDLRARLGTALYALGRLVEWAGIGRERLPLLQELMGSLKDPFIFVIVGEVNVGKSTFLNALFGEEFSAAGVLPTTGKIVHFKYGPKRQLVHLTDTMEEVYAPHDFLKEFHIVDTPGTNSICDEHQQITERFLPMADLVAFVFSAINPWGASCWAFLDRVKDVWMREVVFIVQMADLREPEELEAILEHMRHVSRERYGREFPIFLVSAKKALLAKSSGVDKERLLGESGFLEFEQDISRRVASGNHRTGRLLSVVGSARRILGEVGERMEIRVAGALSRQGALERVETSLLLVGQELARGARRVGAAAAGGLDRSMAGLPRRLGDRGRDLKAVTRSVEQPVIAAAGEQTERELGELLERIELWWEGERGVLEASFGGGGAAGEEGGWRGWDELGERCVGEVSRAVAAVVGGVDVAGRVRAGRRRLARHSGLIAACGIAVLASGIWLVVGWGWPAGWARSGWVEVGGGVLAALGLSCCGHAAWRWRTGGARLVEGVGAELERLRAPLEERAAEAYLSAVAEVPALMRARLSPFREQLERELELVASPEAERQALERTFMEIERELAANR